MKVFLIILGVILGLILIYTLYQVIIRLSNKNSKKPKLVKNNPTLESDVRFLVQPPDMIIDGTGIKEGDKVLEIGAGSGPYTFHAARSAGSNGAVYALDLQEEMIAILRDKMAKEENDSLNVIPVLADALNLPYEDNTFDVVFMVSVLQEIPDKDKAFAEARRVLKPGGHLSISETFIDLDYFMKKTLVKFAKKADMTEVAYSGNFLSYTVCFGKPK